MEEDIKNMSKEELLEYLEDISQQLDNIALDQIQFAISELQFFKEEYKKLKEENKELKWLLDYKEVDLENSIPISELKNDLEHMKNAKATGVKQLLMKKGIMGYLEKIVRR